MGARGPLLCVCLAALAACAEPAGVEPSGFLGDYSRLEPGRGDQAQLVYIDAEADFSPYQRILLDPVVVWEPHAASHASRQELERLADDLGAALRRQLRLEFELVERPAPGTLRLRSAITGVRESGVSVEMEVLDAESGRRLAAVVDARGIGSGSRDAADESASVQDAFEFWAERARIRLAAFRSFDAAEAAHDAKAEP